ncbi:Reverse transcriptase/retrotransposon-derived protein [Theobroma cacao]|nr:Reverse transcriptase/retrotransposon-derived protein [Theobroma cacao]
MVQEGIVLEHRVCSRGIEVDKAKVEIIKKLPLPTSVNGFGSFLGHATLDWNLLYELMCDASLYVVEAILAQQKEKIFHPIYYANKTLNDAQLNYTIAEKKLLAIMFAFDKFCSYLMGTKMSMGWQYLTKTRDASQQHSKEKCLLQLNEMDEFRLQAYESANIYKEKTKRWHDKKIIKCSFQPSQHVLLYNSQLRFSSGKLKSRWSVPFVVTKVFPHVAVELSKENRTFKVNGQRLEHYWGGEIKRQKYSISLINAN